MPAKRELSMRQLRHLLRLHHDGVSAREIGRRLGVARSTIQDNLKRAAAAGLKWPLARRRHRGGSGTPAVWARRDCDRPAAAGRAGLGGLGARAEAARRDDDDPVGGIPRGPSRGLWLQPVLRSATRVRTTADAGDAPAPCRRRQGVRRLFGQADRDRRSDDRRNPRGGDFRRRARRLEPHLCRGDLDATAAGLDRRACAHVPLFRRRAEAAGSRQSEERRQQGLVLRPRDQPHLWRDGVALLRRNPPGAAEAGRGTRRKSRPE